MKKGNETVKEIFLNNMSANDISKYKEELIELMDITLSDNIEQKFPEKLAERYVDKMSGYIEDNSAIIIGAFEGKKLVGFIWGYITHVYEEVRVHSYMGAVNPYYRGYHIAKRLMEKQFEEAKNRGIYIIEAMVTKSNQAAYNWHLKTGFEEERVKMRKVLKSDN